MKSLLTRRAVASLIDYALFYALFVAYVYAVGEVNDSGGFTVTGTPALVIPLSWLLYFPLLESHTGQTLGKMLLGLMVIRSGRKEPGFLNHLQRRLADVIDLNFFGLVAIFTAANTERNQRLGDIWSGLRVVASRKELCPHCGTLVVLDGEEIIKERYACPDCNEQVVLV